MPASLEKLTLEKLKSSKLLPSVVKQGVFLRFSHLFFGSPDKVGRLRDLQNLTVRFADNHKNQFSEVRQKPANIIFSNQYT